MSLRVEAVRITVKRGKKSRRYVITKGYCPTRGDTVKLPGEAEPWEVTSTEVVKNLLGVTFPRHKAEPITVKL